MFRILLVAGALLAFAAAADARPIWRLVPTPLPAPMHHAKVRPPWLGPVWRTWPEVVAAAPTAISTTVPAAVAAAPAPHPPAPMILVQPIAIAPPATEAVAPAAPPSAPVATKPPAPVVVAEKAPSPAPIAALPATSPVSAGETPWGQIMLGIIFAAAVTCAIVFFGGDRKRAA